MKFYLGGAILLALPLFLTSCEGTLDDVFGEWSRPTGNNSNTDKSSDGSAIEYVEYAVSGTTATPTTKTVSEFTEWTGTVAPGNITGTYVVKGTATCTGDLTLTGDVNIILCDGASMTVTGKILTFDGSSYPYSLKIYGQSAGTGELIVNISDGEHGIEGKEIQIHGGNLTATNTDGSFGQALYADQNLYIYGGNVTANSTNGQAIMVNGGTFDFYNATLNATTTSGYSVISNTGTVGAIKINSGTVTATAGTATTVIDGKDINITNGVTKVELTNSNATLDKGDDFISVGHSVTIGASTLDDEGWGTNNISTHVSAITGLSYDTTAKKLTYNPN